MPMGMGQMPMGGGANPQNLQAMAEAGDPRAIAMLQQMQAAQQGGGGGPPQGGPPQDMPPQGGPPQGGMQPAPGGGVTMPQSQFTRPMPPNPDQQARQTQQKIQLLRMLAAQQGQAQ